MIFCVECDYYNKYKLRFFCFCTVNWIASNGCTLIFNQQRDTMVLSSIIVFAGIWRWSRWSRGCLAQHVAGVSKIQEFNAIVIVYCETLHLNVVCNVLLICCCFLLSLHNCLFFVLKSDVLYVNKHDIELNQTETN